MPDYTLFERELSVVAPYVLWNTVDGPLLYRWMDLAYECDYDRVVFHLPDRLGVVEASFGERTRWPVEVEVSIGTRPSGAERYESLFGDVITGDVLSAWELIDRHWLAVTNRLALLWERVLPDFPEVKVGALSRIEPGVRLEAPYWIGSGCSIGRNSVIGPGAVVSDGCVIGGGVNLRSTYVGENQFVAEDTTFDGYHLQDGVALHRKKRLAGLSVDPRLLRTRAKRAGREWWHVGR